MANPCWTYGDAVAKETFLVLGASSFYGSNFANLVEAKGGEAIRLSRPNWNLGDEIPDADYIVNFASRSLVEESWIDPQGWMMTNGVLTTALIEDLTRKDFKKFIHVSTPEVYGHTKTVVKETQKFNPSTPYAVSRATGDMMFMAYHRAKSLPCIITRTANIYGLGQPDHRFIPLAFKTLRAKKKLFLHNQGKTIRGFIHVKDACEATYLLCLKGVVGETYHIAPGGILTIEALAKMICAQLGLRWQDWLGEAPDRVGKDQAYILDSQKVMDLGWIDRITIKEGLAEYGC